MSEVKVNKISPRTNCGTVQLGDSGDTITIPAGATIVNNGTQTGFGRTGTVDWDTTAKTAGFTAVSGNGYFVNTTSGAITVTLPATPSAGDIVGIKDYAGTFATNNVTVGRNGSLIDATATDATLSTTQLSVFFVYVDGTQGWKATQSDAGSYGALYVAATGGTITTCGDYKIHTFTGPGTFTVTCAGNVGGSTSVDYLVVAGGGGGGAHGGDGSTVGGGGGAGGYRESSGAASGCYTVSPLGAGVSALAVSVQGYPITVGGGGISSQPGNAAVGAKGSNSVFSTITSAGGGGGDGPVIPCSAGSGGSGGGAYAQTGGTPGGGSGNTPPVSPPQGQPGGAGTPDRLGGGGGGAIEAGSNGGDAPPTASSRNTGGNGGTTEISGTSTSYAGGGGGANTDGPGNNGGLGGGGPAPTSTSGGIGSNGTANTGGGGGGGPHSAPTPDNGGAGGSGIVIIRYKYQ